MELAEHDIKVSCVMPGIVQTELSVGVPDLPGFKSITPEDVADGIAGTLEKPRLYVFVPRSAGPMLTSTTLLPRRAGLWLAKKMGADRVFTDASHDPSRAAYESRAARTDMAAEETGR
jgi:short-subunit dehydrogenase